MWHLNWRGSSSSHRQTGRNRINGIINKCVFICTAARCRLFLSLFYPQSTTHCQLIESDCGSGIVPKYTSRPEVEGEDDDAPSNRTRAATQCTIVALRMCIMCASPSTRDYNKMTNNNNNWPAPMLGLPNKTSSSSLCQIDCRRGVTAIDLLLWLIIN